MLQRSIKICLEWLCTCFFLFIPLVNATFIVVACLWQFLQNKQKFKNGFKVLFLIHVMPKISTLPPHFLLRSEIAQVVLLCL